MAHFPFDKLKFREIDGIPSLVIAIAQDFNSNEVLMVAFTNEEGIQKTIETGKAHYFSTSRKKLWLKGETSGHVQEVKEILIDCDGDAVLFRVEQEGAACHEGYRSCFFRKVAENGTEIVAEKVFDPDKVY
ncbi:MAG: phosphoribosyl-AMP cyclohydrolase [Candidatus Altiarchaeota archaeon]|nr:phosphoribosyl-AMP cyclohydrolase [Candidatus Altiarchaeota archaeon]MBU4341269.1 phosphoribosyl-AMP cyclohydrolase [Candidatus Altiarchaeota archaeon]MBU4406631.1 phosphoribosyl-AMP cyclohydrolase [Candidatus Altiarchaeota archaeon]MBU4437901.1 phosphoribosyl-AMP cyclohydrolase [Candidatus Altiarchaeota archaeon]